MCEPSALQPQHVAAPTPTWLGSKLKVPYTRGVGRTSGSTLMETAAASSSLNLANRASMSSSPPCEGVRFGRRWAAGITWGSIKGPRGSGPVDSHLTATWKFRVLPSIGSCSHHPPRPPKRGRIDVKAKIGRETIRTSSDAPVSFVPAGALPSPRSVPTCVPSSRPLHPACHPPWPSCACPCRIPLGSGIIS